MSSNDLWITSEGLDIDVNETKTTKTTMLVTYGDLKGNFVSIDTDKNRLVFTTDDISRCFEYLSGAPKTASIDCVGNVYTVSWNLHNYKIENLGNGQFIVCIEEKDEK